MTPQRVASRTGQAAGKGGQQGDSCAAAFKLDVDVGAQSGGAEEACCHPQVACPSRPVSAIVLH